MLIEFLQNFIILVWTGHDRHAAEIFCCGTDHARSADIDILQCVFEGNARLGDGFFKRIQVDRHQVDRLNFFFSDLCHLRRLFPFGQNAGMNGGMQRFNPAVEDLREPGDICDTGDRNLMIPEKLGGAAGG